MVVFDEDDIRQELIEMGYTPSAKLIEDLRRAIHRADQDRAKDENYDSSHPFLGLDVDSARPPPATRDEARTSATAMAEQSPIVIRSATGRNPLRWRPQIPHPIETITFASPPIDGLMDDAFRSVEKMYALVDEAEDLIAAVEDLDIEEMMARADAEARQAISDDSESTARDDNGVEKDEEGGGGRRDCGMNEQLQKSVQRIRAKREGERRKHSCASSGAVGGGGVEGTVAGGGGHGGSEGAMETLPGAAGLEGGVRPVLVPSPGRRPFRFDPVNRIGIYQQEWKRLPAPGEKKRLSLRWKIREQLLHRDVPAHFNRRTDADLPAVRLAVPPLQHDKDWSPRPYLD